MTVKKKASLSSHVDMEERIEEIIQRGGNLARDSLSVGLETTKLQTKITTFTIRVPSELIEQIDQAREQRLGSVSRNQWILEAIAQSLKDFTK